MLQAGTRLGPYEILALIGAGGMGEVYRARDTKLHRDAAIKILPDAVTASRDRIARFHREARLLAALNHPDIATLSGKPATCSRPGTTCLGRHVLRPTDVRLSSRAVQHRPTSGW